MFVWQRHVRLLFLVCWALVCHSPHQFVLGRLDQLAGRRAAVSIVPTVRARYLHSFAIKLYLLAYTE